MSTVEVIMAALIGIAGAVVIVCAFLLIRDRIRRRDPQPRRNPRPATHGRHRGKRRGLGEAGIGRRRL